MHVISMSVCNIVIWKKKQINVSFIEIKYVFSEISQYQIVYVVKEKRKCFFFQNLFSIFHKKQNLKKIIHTFKIIAITKCSLNVAHGRKYAAGGRIKINPFSFYFTDLARLLTIRSRISPLRLRDRRILTKTLSRINKQHLFFI